MVGIEQIRRGAMLYLAKEIVPLTSQGKGILLSAFAPAVMDAYIKKLVAMPWLEDTGLLSGAEVDIDEVYKLIKTAAASKWPIELMGFRFSESDLDKLLRYIKEGY